MITRTTAPFRELYFDELPSTNTWLKEAALAGQAEPGLVVIAGHQTAGRGRLGRTWVGSAGASLTFSVLCEAFLPPDKIGLFSLLAGLAVKGGLEQYCTEANLLHASLNLRWPNDILTGNRKLAGLLCESAADPAGRRLIVVGVGVNVNQVDADFPSGLRTPASSLYQITGTVVDPRRILPFLLSGLEETTLSLRKFGADWLLKKWLDESGLIGKQVEVREGTICIEGRVEGLDKDGALILLQGSTRRTVRTGEVESLR